MISKKRFGRRQGEGASALVFVLPKRNVRGWPGASTGVGEFIPLAELLTRRFSTDAHFAQYVVQSHPYRLLAEAHERLPCAPSVHHLVFDVDSEEAHRLRIPATDEWFDDERPKIDRLLTDIPGGFIYRTTGGYRIFYTLPAPFVVDGPEAEYAWRLRYIRSGVQLKRAYDIGFDPTCKSWVWLFRAPRATRDPGLGPENRECIGDPTRVGAWTYDPH